MKIAIVVPAHIPLNHNWIQALDRESVDGNADVIIVDDSDGHLNPDLPASWRVFGHQAQEDYLGVDLYAGFAHWFHKSSACRVFGHIFAYREGYDIVIGLDSDCVVPHGFVADHVKLLNQKKAFGWSNPLGNTGWYPRGFPYSMRNWPIVANMGLWDNVLDLNGKDRNPHEPHRLNVSNYQVAPSPIPFSGMNFALVRDAIPGFLFLPNFTHGEWKFGRHDDIWGGFIFQLLAKCKKQGVIYGQPVVFHDTVVDALADAQAERAIYHWENDFFAVAYSAFAKAYANDFSLEHADYLTLFSAFVDAFSTFVPGTPFVELIPAMRWWVEVFKNEI